MATLNTYECASALRAGSHTDFVISCDGISFDAHRFMLSISSTYFAAMLRNEFQEKVEGKAKLGGTHRHAIEPYVMAQVLDFIYLGDYTTREPVIRYYLDPEEEPDTGSNRFFMSGPKGQNAKLEFHICMYLAAKRLMIEKLRVKAMRRVCDMLESDLDGFPGQQPSPEVLDFLLHEKNTAADDDLRFRVVNLCVNNPNLRVLPNIRYVLEKHEPVAYKLGLEFLQKIEEMF